MKACCVSWGTSFTAGDLAQGTLHGPVYARALNQHTVRQCLCYSRYLCVLQSLAVLWVNNVLLYQHGGQGAEQTTSFKMLWQKENKRNCPWQQALLCCEFQVQAGLVFNEICPAFPIETIISLPFNQVAVIPNRNHCVTVMGSNVTNTCSTKYFPHKSDTWLVHFHS